MIKGNKKVGVILIIFGVILLIFSGVLFVSNHKKVADDKTDKPNAADELVVLKEKISFLTSDKYCNLSRNIEDDMGCIYFRNNTKKSDISPMYKLYYLVLSNISDNTAVDLDSEDEKNYIEKDFVYFITHKVDADKIKSLYIDLYGEDDFNANSLDNFDTIPRVKYDSLENKFLVYYSDKEDIGSYVLYYPEGYEKSDNNYYVYVKCIYVRKVNMENDSTSYLIYKSFDSKEAFDSKEKYDDILNYDVSLVAEDNVSRYKFTFLKEYGNYSFVEATKIS